MKPPVLHRARERGQALVEAAVLLPVCVTCALALVDAGVLVRDRIAVAQAAARAAEAQVVEGSGGHGLASAARAAAIGALPNARRSHARVNILSNRASAVRVEIDGGSRIARLVGRRVRLTSTASFE